MIPIFNNENRNREVTENFICKQLIVNFVRYCLE